MQLPRYCNEYYERATVQRVSKTRIESVFWFVDAFNDVRLKIVTHCNRSVLSSFKPTDKSDQFHKKKIYSNKQYVSTMDNQIHGEAELSATIMSQLVAPEKILRGSERT